MDHSVRPVQEPVRIIPLELESRVKEKLDIPVEDKIVAPVDCHTPWISNVVTVIEKSGEISLCFDLEPLNHALKQNHFLMLTLNDVLPYLHNAKYLPYATQKMIFDMLSLTFLAVI